MPIVIQIFLLVFAGIFFLGAFGEKDFKKARLYTISGFIAAALLVFSSLFS